MLRRRQSTDANSPGRLAEEFGRAWAEFEARRENIIQRGTQRVSEIDALVSELRVERDDLAVVISDARS